jgi:hypothetical protein
MRITLFSSRSFILRKINKAWKVYKRGKGISNLVAEKAYLGVHHGCLFNRTMIKYLKCPNFVKHRQNAGVFQSK